MSQTTRKMESVWDYPRPPRVEPVERRVEVKQGETVVADTRRPVRVLETSHPPVFYVPPDDVNMDMLRPNPHSTYCEFKGMASYWDLEAGTSVSRVGWSYPNPSKGYESITNWIAFYPSKVDCFVDGELVESQDGGFYGGWITSEIKGPFKGGPGTSFW